MSERPFMQLYVSDFIGDTLHLNTEQIGAYMLLLMAMWNAGGKLPADDAKLARVVRMSLKKWRAIKGELMGFFASDDASIWHHRLTKELEKSERQSQSRAFAGSRGGAATALKNNKSAPANAAAKLAAKPQHLPEPYRKKRVNALDLTEGTERINKNVDRDLFARCVALSGESVPDFIEAKSFPVSIIAKARREAAH